jgi:valyl-tRNA synthetase
MSDAPAGFQENQRNQAGGFAGEADVFDTWFTSSLTPQIGSRWIFDQSRHQKLFPADLRPQSHEIIRTWAFYTIAKAYLHEKEIPWKNIAISGWILDPDRKKMSKSKGNVITPMHLLDEYSADGVRYWAASARLGMDTAFDEQVLKVGRRLTTKLYNAAKFVLQQSGPSGKPVEELDLAFLALLKKTVERSSQSFQEFNFAQALQDTEKFFWTHFTDSYIELAKNRAKGGEAFSASAQASALVTLRFGLDVMLRLFAPFLPYICEEIWSWTNSESIHKAPWPKPSEFKDFKSTRDELIFADAMNALSTIHKHKTENGMTVGSPVAHLKLLAPSASAERLTHSLKDLSSASRVERLTLEGRADLETYRIELA